MKKAKITALIYAKDEEAALPGLIRNLRGAADEIILLDGGSTDATRAIAKRMGVRVIIRKKEHAEHVSEESNNYYKKFARNNWVLGIDCDELLTPELKRALPQLVSDGRYKAYRFKRRNYVAPGKWCRRCFYPNYQLRLWDGRFISFPKEVHTEASVQGDVKDTPYEMLHLVYLRGRDRAKIQHQEYSKAEPESLANPLAFALSYAAVFCHFFFFRLGILEPHCWKFLLVRVDYYARHSSHSKNYLSRLLARLPGVKKDH